MMVLQGERQHRLTSILRVSDWPFWLVCLLYALACWATAHLLLTAALVDDRIDANGRFRDGRGNIVAHPTRTGLSLERGDRWSH